MELFGKEGVKGNLESRIGNSERENQKILLEQFDDWQCDTFDLVCGKLKMAEEDRIKIENKLKSNTKRICVCRKQLYQIKSDYIYQIFKIYGFVLTDEQMLQRLQHEDCSYGNNFRDWTGILNELLVFQEEFEKKFMKLDNLITKLNCLCEQLWKLDADFGIKLNESNIGADAFSEEEEEDVNKIVTCCENTKTFFEIEEESCAVEMSESDDGCYEMMDEIPGPKAVEVKLLEYRKCVNGEDLWLRSKKKKKMCEANAGSDGYISTLTMTLIGGTMGNKKSPSLKNYETISSVKVKAKVKKKCKVSNIEELVGVTDVESGEDDADALEETVKRQVKKIRRAKLKARGIEGKSDYDVGD